MKHIYNNNIANDCIYIYIRIKHTVTLVAWTTCKFRSIRNLKCDNNNDTSNNTNTTDNDIEWYTYEYYIFIRYLILIVIVDNNDDLYWVHNCEHTINIKYRLIGQSLLV